MFLLEIERAAPRARPTPDGTSLHFIRGGSGALLNWLETHLGFPHSTTRVERHLAAHSHLANATLGVAAASFGTDRWGTTRELLDRWDELRIAGWSGKADAALPPLLRDLVTLGESPLPPGEAERVEWFLRGTEPVDAVRKLAKGLPRIIAPVAGTIIALDPDIPSLNQRLAFEAQGGGADSRWVLGR